jgi:hypothetical protein
VNIESDFVVMDCTLLTCMSGLPPAHNLRELRDRITACSDNVLYHHFCETLLRATFDDPEYRNDFAVWAKDGIGDRVLAERLGVIDPYVFESTGELRSQVLEIIEERLAELSPWVPTARPGREFFLMNATTVVFDTGVRLATADELGAGITQMSNGSIFYHFLEGLRRPPRMRDDFSAWLMHRGEREKNVADQIASLDFYFKGLPALRDDLARIINADGRGNA